MSDPTVVGSPSIHIQTRPRWDGSWAAVFARRSGAKLKWATVHGNIL